MVRMFFEKKPKNKPTHEIFVDVTVLTDNTKEECELTDLITYQIGELLYQKNFSLENMED